MLEHFSRIMLYEIYISSECNLHLLSFFFFLLFCLFIFPFVSSFLCNFLSVHAKKAMLVGWLSFLSCMVLKLNFSNTALTFCFFGNSSDTFLFFSGNYGGALGANALGKGLEGNKSLRVLISFTSTYLSVPHGVKIPVLC